MKLQKLRDSVDQTLWRLEIKQRDANRKVTASYRDELQNLYKSWLADFLPELEKKEDKQKYIAAALLLLGRRLKELQRKRLLEAFNIGLTGDPASPNSLVELSRHIVSQEEYIDTSLLPHLEEHFLTKLDELDEIGQEAFEESLLKRAYRVGKYAGAFWGAIQGAQVWISDSNRICTWVSLDDEGTCVDCAEYHMKEYTKLTLPTLPGGDVQCNGSCRCLLIWEGILEIWPYQGGP